MSQPRHLPSAPGPQARSTRISPSLKGIQSMPRSRSQARTAAMGRRHPETFSYPAMVTQSEPSGFMVAMMPLPIQPAAVRPFRAALTLPRSQFSEAVWWCLTGGSAATEYVPRLLFIRRPPRPAVAAGFPTQARYRRDTTGSRRPTATARPATRLRVARRVLSTRPVLVAPCRDPAAAPSPDRAHVRRPRSPPLPTRGSSSTC